MYISYYSNTCFPDKNKLYYRILKKDVKIFLKPYYEFKKETDDRGKSNIITLQLEKYCKPPCPPINFKLRTKTELNDSDKKLMKILDGLINQFRIENDTIVYRVIDKDVFGNEKNYVERGYLSTSLVKESIYFCRNKDYIYKIFIPKGSFGFCPSVFTCRNIEYEFILPRNAKLQLIRKIKKKKQVEIVCKYINSEI